MAAEKNNSGPQNGQEVPVRAKTVKKRGKRTIDKIKRLIYIVCVVILALAYFKNELAGYLEGAQQSSSGTAQSEITVTESGTGQIISPAAAEPEIEYILAGSAASHETDVNGNTMDHSNLLVSIKDPSEVLPKGFSLSNVPEYRGNKYCVVNGNVPFFTASEIALAKKGAFEYYGPLDRLGRCTVAFDCLGKETMPPSGQKRGQISKVYPTGWKQNRYDCVDSETVMTRAHLAGYMLSAENANECNLVSGTRYMNSDAMLEFEEQTSDYLYHNRNRHVLYRVTPVFRDDELMPRGVLMEARSVEDNGFSLQYCVYIYNVQPGLNFDYKTGKNWYNGVFLDSDSGTVVIDGIKTANYGLDLSTNTIHTPFCSEFAKVPMADRLGFIGDSDCVSIWYKSGYKTCSCLKK